MVENINVFAIEHYIRLLNAPHHKLFQMIAVPKKEQNIIQNVYVRVTIIKLAQEQTKKEPARAVPITEQPSIPPANVKQATL